MAFGICAKVKFQCLSVSEALSYLEFLVDNGVSTHMISNHISAIRAMFVMYDLPYGVWNHPKIKYFVKSTKMTRPIACPREISLI